MNRKLMIATIGAGLMLAPAAIAQDAGTAAPGAMPPAAAPANFADADLQKFARAQVKVAQIQADDSVAAGDKQGKMLEAVQGEGLTPQQFNDIAQAAQTDPALQQKIQQASPAAPAQSQQ